MKILGVPLSVLALTLPLQALALDQVDLRLVGLERAPSVDKEEFTDILRSASVLETLAGDDETNPRDVIAAARSDYSRLVEAMYAQGHYSVVVSIRLDGREASQMDPFSVPDQIRRAEITVDPGRRFRFGRAVVAPVAPGTTLPEEFRPGRTARATRVRDAAQTAVSGWRDSGYAKAEITNQTVTARHPQAELDVEIAIAPGPQVRFGEVIVGGDSRVRPTRIRAIAGLPQGELYMPATVEKAATRLRETGTFQAVQLSEGEVVKPDGTMDIGISVIDRAPRRIGGGLELSSIDGLTVAGYWLHRNLLGGAETLRLDGEVAQIGGAGSGIDYSLTARFEKPAVYGPDTKFFTTGELVYLEEPDYTERRAGLAFGASRDFTDNLTGELALGVSYSKVEDRYSAPPAVIDREFLVFNAPAALTWDRRNDELDATDGFYLRLEGEPFHEAERGYNAFRLGVDARGYVSFGESSGTVLAGRVQLGALFGPDAVDAPPNYLYYSGGGGTVRGQPYQSLDADYGGASFGGRSFAGLQGEVRFAVTDTIGVVAFADAGYIGTESFVNGDGEWHAGAGLGVRYKTPVGPIRADIAGPIAGDTGDGVHVYIGIGQAF
jgi:translocation and assembly module TamA